jgi:hypothetical protein
MNTTKKDASTGGNGGGARNSTTHAVEFSADSRAGKIAPGEEFGSIPVGSCAAPRNNGRAVGSAGTNGADRDVTKVTLHEFITSILFVDRHADVWIIEVPGDPTTQEKTGWAGRVYSQQHNIDVSKNLYVVVSEIELGAPNRKDKNFAAYHVFVLDDVGICPGAKVNPKKILLRPTYRIETSPGNEQWGFVFRPPPKDKTKIKRLADGAKLFGATDKGGTILTRAVRLPGGINGKAVYGDKPFRVHLTEFNPKAIYTDPEEIATALGYTLEGQRGRPRESDLPPIAPDTDPILKLLDRLGMVRTRVPNKNGFVDIDCPWASEHSEGDGSAGYVPGGGFKCFHDHCAERRFADLVRWLKSDTWFELDPTPPRGCGPWAARTRPAQ